MARRFFFDQKKVSANRAKKMARGGLATYTDAQRFNDGGEAKSDSNVMSSISPSSDQGKVHGEVKDKMAVINKGIQNLQAMPIPNAMDFAKMREQISAGGGAEFRQQLPNILLAEAERAEQARAAQRAELQKQIDSPSSKWSEAERWFKVSHALAQPSQTGGLGGTLSNFAKAGSEYATSKSAEEKAQRELKMKMLELEGMDPKTAANLIKIGESQKAEDEAGKIADSLGLTGKERKDFITKHYKEKRDLEWAKANNTQKMKHSDVNRFTESINKTRDALAELNSQNSSIAFADEKVSGLLSPEMKRGLERSTGVTGWFKSWPGGAAANFEANIAELKSTNFLNAIQAMKGFGALSNAEGLKVEAAIRDLNLNQSPEQILQKIEDIQRYYKGLKEANRKEYSLKENELRGKQEYLIEHGINIRGVTDDGKPAAGGAGKGGNSLDLNIGSGNNSDPLNLLNKPAGGKK